MITRVDSSMMQHYWILRGEATPPPLIRSFATNQRREVPTWEPQARQRWLTWYLDFTISHDSINEDRSAFAALDEEYKNIVAAL